MRHSGPSLITQERNEGLSNTGGPISGATKATRQRLATKFLEEVIFGQMRQLLTWKTVTNQTAQLDSGYLAQQLVSILTGISGSGLRGKGDDLSDGSEIKAANTIQSTDTPRWNHSLKNDAKVNEHIAKPAIFYVLFDTLKRDTESPFRCRVWKVEPAKDVLYRQLVQGWNTNRPASRYNMQIQPPRWEDSNRVSCFGSELQVPLFFHAQQKEMGDLDFVVVRSFTTSPGVCKKVS